MAIVQLPQFNHLDLEHYVDRLAAQLSENLQKIEELLAKNIVYTWDNLMRPLEDMEDRLEKFWSPMSHLHAVVNSKALREVYQACLPKLSAYESATGHNQALYLAIKSIDKHLLNATQQKIVTDTLQGFELSGVSLPLEKQHRFEAIQARLSELSNQFENHVLDATQAFQLEITDEARLKGLPEHAKLTAKALAEEKKLPGFVFNLEFPCYLAVVTYAEDRALREALYRAYVTRASDQGPSAGRFDNTAIMDEMLALRHEKATLLGFANYATLSITTKMASSCDEVTKFLLDLGQRAYPQAQTEMASLKAFGQKEYQLDHLEPWDIAFLSEKKKEAEHTISDNELRAYFPLPTVMKGLFQILHTLYGMQVEEVPNVDTWHPDVTCYRIQDQSGTLRGYVYVDLYARPNKRGGAWMDSLQGRRSNGDALQIPIATLTCNFTKPVANKIPTLSHDEVQTLFHEFGHCVHHIFTQVDYLSAAGINGVEWDAVELPSQFFENWCWEKEALQRLTSHVDTGAPLPPTLFEKLIAAKNFQSAMAMLRQLEFSLFDFRIHQEYTADIPHFIVNILSDVRQQFAVVPIAPFNRFQHSFSHIFAGGYSAGYYSYKWAEVLSSDAFSRFEEEGIFNEKTGRDFLQQILEVGGSRPAETSYIAFRGRPATGDALLRHNGIS